MQVTNFIELFMEFFILCASLLIIFLITSILLIMHRVDKGLFKARLFLNDVVMQRTWIYISVAGASFALNTLIVLLARSTAAGEMLSAYYLTEITRLIFLAAFILAIWNWYEFMGSFDKRRKFEMPPE